MTTTDQSTEDTEIRPMTRESFTAAVEAEITKRINSAGPDNEQQYTQITLHAGIDVAWAEITRLQEQLDDAVGLVQRCAGFPGVPSHAAVIGELAKEIERYRIDTRAQAVELEALRELRLDVARILGISHHDNGLNSQEITQTAHRIVAELGEANLSKDEAVAQRTRLADGISEILASIEHVPCIYFSCPGPMKPTPEPRCSGCDARVALKELLAAVTAPAEPASQP